PLEVRVDVGLARLHEVHFDLAQTAPVHAVAPERRAVPTETPKSETAEAPSAPPAREHQTPQAIASATAGALNTWGWVTLAAGGVGLGVAGGLELVRRDAESDAASTRVQVDKQAALERMDDAMWGARVAGAV